jgi:cation:H+ antiporter
MMIALLILGGLLLLVVGGELLVRGAVRFAERLGVSPLMIGLTLVGFGTSTPELVTSVQASAIGSPGIAVGNIVGSNIANILLILGLSAVIYPMAVSGQALRRDGVLVLVAALLLAGVGVTAGLIRPIGVAFVGLLIAYLVYAYLQERRGSADHTAAFERAEAMELADPGLRPRAGTSGGFLQMAVPLLMALAGLAIVILGGRFLVDGAVQLARGMGMSETLIGLTIVAVGTSMPEFVTSILAAFRKQADVAVGNILGSNIYNILGIGGLTALIAPTVVPPQIAAFDLPVMVAASLALLVFAWTGARISRGEGALLVGAYVAYIGYLIFTSSA